MGSATDLQVANLALSALGAKTIDSFEDQSAEAKLAKSTFEMLARDCLRSHPWNFAIARKTISEDGSAPDWGFDKRYPLPSQCLRVIEVLDSDPENYPWQVEGQYIVTDLGSPIKVKYIKDVTDTPGLWDDSFAVALAKKCVAAWEEQLVKAGVTHKQLVNEDAFTSIRMARSNDGQEGSVVKIDNASWLDSR